MQEEKNEVPKKEKRRQFLTRVLELSFAALGLQGVTATITAKPTPSSTCAPTATATATPTTEVSTGAFIGRSTTIDPFWTKIFEDDFSTLAPEGQFLALYKNWNAYPVNYLTTQGQQSEHKGDHYGTSNIRVKDVDGVRAMVCSLIPGTMTDDKFNLGAAPYPRFDVGLGEARSRSMKIEMRVRIPNQVSGWHAANLLWFDDESWPGGGEDDFWEQSTPGKIGAFFHNAGASSGGDQRHFSTDISPTDWHVIGAEHVTSTSFKWFVDSKQIPPDDGGDDNVGSILKRVPAGVARLVLQNEPDGSPSQPMEIHYDWITCWVHQ